MKLIDGEKLLYAVQGAIDVMDAHGMDTVGATSLKAIIKCAPTVDAIPVVHGRWICRGDFAPGMWECDVCRKWCMVKGNVYRYCPSCGAKMDVSDNDATD